VLNCCRATALFTFRWSRALQGCPYRGTRARSSGGVAYSARALRPCELEGGQEAGMTGEWYVALVLLILIVWTLVAPE
jgi:hypothetical protein